MSLAENLAEIGEKVEQLERVNEKAQQQVVALKDELAKARRRLAELEQELAYAQDADEIRDFIADVERGIYSIDELYEAAR